MNILHLPWIEVAVGLALAGFVVTSFLRDPIRAHRTGMVFTGLVFACTFFAWLAEYADVPAEALRARSLQPSIFGSMMFWLDELSAPMVPAIALLHFLTATATARTHMRRFSVSWSLATEAITLATFSCQEPWVLIGLLALSTVPPYVELVIRKRSTRVYLVHMLAFVVVLALGWAAVEVSLAGQDIKVAPWWAVLPLLLAVLIRAGTVPMHCWLTDWFEHASFGIGLLFVLPLTGVYTAVRLVLPVSPAWVLQWIGLLSLVTAVYAAGMATIQRETRRLFAHLFLSHASLVLVGLELHTELTLTASLCLWFSVILSLGGFGLTLRALESRFGRMSLTRFHGLYDHTPALAVFFLLTGLATVGFPGTLGFISTELLVDSTIETNLFVGLLVIAAAAFNGIAILRAYFLLFTGSRHTSSVSLRIGLRERIAVMTLTALILGGGLYPQPGVNSRFKAAGQLLEGHEQRLHGKPAAKSERTPHG